MIPQVALVLLMLAFLASGSRGTHSAGAEWNAIVGIVFLSCLPALVGKIACRWHFRFYCDGVGQERCFDRFWSRLVLWQFVVWVMSSYSTVWFFRWPATIMGCIPQGDFPPVREILFLFPATVSWILAVVWGQSGCHAAMNANNLEKWNYRTLKKCMRMWIAFIAVPLAVMSITHQLVTSLDHISSEMQILLGSIGTLVLLVLVPKLILILAFEKRKLHGSLVSRLQKRLGTRHEEEAEFFVWNTDREICNAMCFKSWRGSRQVIFSDLMIEYFSEGELEAVARHELAHLDRGHAGWRFLALLFPFTCLFSLQSLEILALFRFENSSRMFIEFSIPGIMAITATALVSVVFFGWISRQCEYDADFCAVNSGENTGVNITTAMELIGVLQKMIIVMPEQGDRSWGGHPSLESRISRIEELIARRLGTNIETRGSRTN